MPENMLTTKEVSEMLKVSQCYIPVLVRRGHFPGARKLDPTRRNSHLRIPLQDVMDYLKFQIVIPDKVVLPEV